MKVTIITTEASGDFLGAALYKELKKRKAYINGIGGKLLTNEGLNSWVSIHKFNTIGLFEVLIRLPKFLKILNYVEHKIRENPPDLLITIDSPSFSYRLVKRIQDLRTKTKIVHYVAPTVWAWKEYRAKIFSELYDKLYTLFKFENKFFRKYGLSTKWVGHQIFYEKKKISKSKTICFLPGSREVEIKKNLTKMKNIINDITLKYKNYKFYILTFDYYKKFIKQFINRKNITVVTSQSKKQKIMSESILAIAASGSVTLELCKYQTPTIVVYDTNFFTKIILKILVKVKFASLINIFFNKEILPELLFEDFTYKNVFREFDALLFDKKKRDKQLKYMKVFSTKMLNNENPAKIIVDQIFKN